MTRLMLACSAALLLSACAEPFTVFAGGKLEGPDADPPSDWAHLSHIDTVQLETRPVEPYSVNIWTVAIGPDVYVTTGEDGTNWTEHIGENADVRLRIEHDVFPLRAVRILDPAERRRVSEAYVAKYGTDPDDSWVTRGQIFRLDRR